MFKRIKLWYHRRLFMRIYFIYLKHSDKPQDAVNDAYEVSLCVFKVMEEKL